MKSVHIQLHPSLLFMDDSSQKKIFHYKIYDNFSLSYLLWYVFWSCMCDNLNSNNFHSFFSRIFFFRTILAILTIIITRPVHCIVSFSIFIFIFVCLQNSKNLSQILKRTFTGWFGTIQRNLKKKYPITIYVFINFFHINRFIIFIKISTS